VSTRSGALQTFSLLSLVWSLFSGPMHSGRHFSGISVRMAAHRRQFLRRRSNSHG